jgi:hypothetical protein
MKTKAYNMKSRNGNYVPNQFEIYTDDGVYFQSYRSIIAFKPCGGKTQLDETYWDYSRTTSKYLNQFLRVSGKKEIEQKIKAGEYELANLN